MNSVASAPGTARDLQQDRWLDMASRRRSAARAFWRDYLNYPRLWSRKLWRFLRTTPGKMTWLIVVLTAMTLAAGLSMSNQAAQRRIDYDNLITNTEPVSYMAQHLYSSLSLANTYASASFVTQGADARLSRNLYEGSYQTASQAIVTTAGGLSTTDAEEMELIRNINHKLPIYTGLVETAWANNRQGNPVGIAYMNEASTLMREDILPSAARLYSLTTETVTAEQRQLTRPLWLPISGLAAALVALLLVQVWLARVTNRRLNRGMVAATALMVIATSWVITANALTWQAGSRAHEEAVAPLQAITDARIRAQQARTSEMLALVWRQSVDTSARSFLRTTDSISHTLAMSPSPMARSAEYYLSQWQGSHQELVNALQQGDYDQATHLALESESATAYNELDTAMAALIDENRQTLREFITKGIAASTFVSGVVLALSLFAILSVWIGIRPRIQEYL